MFLLFYLPPLALVGLLAMLTILFHLIVRRRPLPVWGVALAAVVLAASLAFGEYLAVADIFGSHVDLGATPFVRLAAGGAFVGGLTFGALAFGSAHVVGRRHADMTLAKRGIVVAAVLAVALPAAAAISGTISPLEIIGAIH